MALGPGVVVSRPFPSVHAPRGGETQPRMGVGISAGMRTRVFFKEQEYNGGQKPAIISDEYNTLLEQLQDRSGLLVGLGKHGA